MLTFKQSNNPIITKVYLFLMTAIFQVMIISIDNIKSKSKIKYKSILNKSLLVGLSSVVGYSLYHDLFNINDSITSIIVPYTTNKLTHSMIITTMIIIPVIIYKILFEESTLTSYD